tara:strand:+ start:665 stop:1018 length:354 start_codon:yes stop_codon:yes gene_type:complete
MNKEQIHCGKPTCDMKDCACAKMFSKQTWSDSVDKLNENMTAEEYQDSLSEWDSIFDPAEKPEYSQDQLIRFAELFAEHKNKNNKTTGFDSWLNELEDGDQPTCNVENPEDCENCGS